MKLGKIELEKLKLKYGAVTPIQYNRPGTLDNIEFIVRKPKIDEYMFFNKHVTIKQDSKGVQSYELDPNYMDIYISKVIVWPEDHDINKIPVGVMIYACNESVNLYDFEDKDKLADMYKLSLTSINTQIGAIVAKLVQAFGIQAYKDIKDLSEHEIVDLVVLVESITDTYGDFAKIADIADRFTFDKKGKLDINRLLGLKAEQEKSGLNEKKKRQLYNHYKSLNYTDDEITDMVNKLENKGRKFEDNNKRDDGKIDLNRMDDAALNNLSKDDYRKLKEEGKIMSHSESLQGAMEDSKSALARTIEEDIREYGENAGADATIGPKHFTGDFDRLLTDISKITKNMDVD